MTIDIIKEIGRLYKNSLTGPLLKRNNTQQFTESEE